MPARKDSPLLMGTWRYAPLIHWADNNRMHARGIHMQINAECYELLHVEAGQVEIAEEGRTKRIVPPTAILRLPKRGPAVSVPPASSFIRLAFDVVRVACLRTSKRSLSHRTPKAQPPPEQVWGIRLPAVVPEPLRASCQVMCTYCAGQWWRGDLEFMNANARLGQWLAGLITHIAQEDGEHATSWVGQSKEALRRCIDQPTRVWQVAEFLGMSRSRFSARFREETGATPSQYLRDLRMREACRLLAMTDYPIARIAGLCGSRSPNTFCNQFRKRYGLSPTKYRRRERTAQA